MDNKKEACVNRHDIKEEKKKERFDIFMAAREKKINVGNQKSKLKEKKTKLEERRVEPRALQRKPKMLAIKMDELDLDVPKVVQAVLEKMLNHLPNELSVRISVPSVDPLALATLSTVWVQIRGLPPPASDEGVICGLSRLLGKFVAVDGASLPKGPAVRVQIKSPDPSKLKTTIRIFFNDAGYDLHISVEGGLPPIPSARMMGVEPTPSRGLAGGGGGGQRCHSGLTPSPS
nr:predicted protein [Triticum aestivum]